MMNRLTFLKCLGLGALIPLAKRLPEAGAEPVDRKGYRGIRMGLDGRPMILHVGRQTGKTAANRAYRDFLAYQDRLFKTPHQSRNPTMVRTAFGELTVIEHPFFQA